MSTVDPVLRNLAQSLEDPVRHAAVLRTFPGLLWCADASGACNFVNAAWEAYTGRAASEAQGGRWLEHVHVADRGAVRAAWQEAFVQRRRFEHEYRIARAGGEYAVVRHAVGERLQLCTQHLVIVASERIARDERALGIVEHGVGVARAGGLVVEPHGDDRDGAGDELRGTRAARAMRAESGRRMVPIAIQQTPARMVPAMKRFSHARISPGGGLVWMKTL